MSHEELDRVTVVQRAIDRRTTVTDAAKQLGITRRQMSRLISAFKSSGAEALISKRRGKPSNRAFDEVFKAKVLALVRENYGDFGPTLAAEKLSDRHSIKLAPETLRQWMIGAGIWTDRRASRERVYQPRYRRDCFGELIQVDGSHHAWFEGRGPKCCLLVFIDDATSRIVELRFCPAESTFDYMQSTKRYLATYGKPVALYSDKHSVFRVNKKEAKAGTGFTQFGRALRDLNIDIIYANSSQAKGRVERMNLTLQDRLVKELRLESIDCIDAANEFLPGYLETINTKFAKLPLNPTDLHRPLTEFDDLEEAMCWQEERTVSSSLTIQYDRVMFKFDPGPLTADLRRKTVVVFDYPDGTIAVKHDGVPLPYSTFDKIGNIKQADIVDSKRLGAVLAFAKQRQEELGLKRSQKAPSRRGQKPAEAAITRQINPAVPN